MAAERVPMRKLREILRLKLECGLRTRAIARSCKLSVSTVSGYLGRAQVATLGWPLPPELDDDRALTRLLFPDEGKPVFGRPEPDYAWIHRELRRKHVTRALLWQEYREQHDAGYEYSQFCGIRSSSRVADIRAMTTYIRSHTWQARREASGRGASRAGNAVG